MKSQFLQYSALGLSMLASGAIAETTEDSSVSGNFYIFSGMGQLDAPVPVDLDVSTKSIAFEGGFFLNRVVSVGLDFQLMDTTWSDGADSITFSNNRLSVEPEFKLNENFSLGAYWTQNSLSVFNESIDFSSYGASVGFNSDALELQAYAGRTFLEDVLGPDNIEANNAGISGIWNVSDSFRLFGHVNQTKIQDPIPGAPDFSMAAIGVEYAVSDRLNLYGAYGTVKASELADLEIQSTTFGMLYDLEKVGMLGSVMFEWSQTDLGGFGPSFGTNLFTLGWSVPIGGAAPSSQSCAMRQARGQARAPLASVFTECSGLPFI